MMTFDPGYIPRPLPPDGSTRIVKHGLRKGHRVTVLEPLITDPEVKPVQVMVRFENGETWAKFPIELEKPSHQYTYDFDPDSGLVYLKRDGSYVRRDDGTLRVWGSEQEAQAWIYEQEARA